MFSFWHGSLRGLGRPKRAIKLLAFLGPLVLASSAFGQFTDLCENNASRWAAFTVSASGRSPATILQSTTRVRSGLSSIAMRSSGTIAEIQFPASGAAAWDLSSATHLVFSDFPASDNVTITRNGFRQPNPTVTLRSGTSTIRFTASTSTDVSSWRVHRIPLQGGTGWIRTQTGTPTLGRIDQILIAYSTWEPGFEVTLDGMQFLNASSAPPPLGPAPPSGVDPEVTTVKLLLIVNNPILPNFGGVRMTQHYRWLDPILLTQRTIQDLETSSHGRVRFELVEVIEDDEFPYLESGFQYTGPSFDAAWTSSQLQPGTFDYTRFSRKHNLGARADSGAFDEVWLYSFPGAGLWESSMLGRNGYFVNGPTYAAAGGERGFILMGLNYERGVAEALHSWGHRAESILVHSYGRLADPATMWGRFTLLDKDSPTNGGVGNIHYPVNGQTDYDYANPRIVSSTADDWLAYPNLQGTKSNVSRSNWARPDGDFSRGYLNWWYKRIPHSPGRAPDGFLANWWRYLADVEQFKGSNGNLTATTLNGNIQWLTPTNNESVSGILNVSANAWVDGALGRVDFYVDGTFEATDSIAPFTLQIDTSSLSNGPHVLTAKAYELQRGTEFQSSPLTIRVSNPAAPPQAPRIRSAQPVVGSFGGSAAFSSNTYIEIYGQNLAANTRLWEGRDFAGANAPTSLDGVSVLVNGKPAFTYYVSPSQINVNTPEDPITGRVSLQVRTPAGNSNTVFVNRSRLAPVLQTVPQFSIAGKQYVVALTPDFQTYIGRPGMLSGLAFQPARPGDTIAIYALGCGPTSPPTRAGVVAQTASALALPFEIKIGGVAARVSFAGAVQGTIGLYQFNVVVPAVAAGDQPIQLTVDGVENAQQLSLTVAP